MVIIISVFGPHRVSSDEDNNNSYNDNLSAEMQSKDGNCILLGNFNGHLGSSIDEYEGIHGRHG